MSRLLATAAVVLLIVSASIPGSTQGPPQFEKKHYNYAEWTKGRFSEVVVVSGPARTIFLAGIGAEDETGKPGDIRHLGDFRGQCKYVFEKIKNVLALHGATMGDVARMVTYVTDIRYQPLFGPCRSEAFAGATLPAHTFLNINQLAWPGMLVEVDVTAMVPMK